MHEIGTRVINQFQLVFYLEHRLHAVLHRAKRMGIRRAAPTLDDRALRCNQFIKQRIVAAKASVQLIVVATIAHVDRPN